MARSGDAVSLCVDVMVHITLWYLVRTRSNMKSMQSNHKATLAGSTKHRRGNDCLT